MKYKNSAISGNTCTFNAQENGKLSLDLPEPIGKAQSTLLNSFPSAPHTEHVAGASFSTVFPQ
jgi:hypothetical protein